MKKNKLTELINSIQSQVLKLLATMTGKKSLVVSDYNIKSKVRYYVLLLASQKIQLMLFNKERSKQDWVLDFDAKTISLNNQPMAPECIKEFYQKLKSVVQKMGQMNKRVYSVKENQVLDVQPFVSIAPLNQNDLKKVIGGASALPSGSMPPLDGSFKCESDADHLQGVLGVSGPMRVSRVPVDEELGVIVVTMQEFIDDGWEFVDADASTQSIDLQRVRPAKPSVINRLRSAYHSRQKRALLQDVSRQPARSLVDRIVKLHQHLDCRDVCVALINQMRLRPVPGERRHDFFPLVRLRESIGFGTICQLLSPKEQIELFVGIAVARKQNQISLPQFFQLFFELGQFMELSISMLEAELRSGLGGDAAFDLSDCMDAVNILVNQVSAKKMSYEELVTIARIIDPENRFTSSLLFRAIDEGQISLSVYVQELSAADPSGSFLRNLRDPGAERLFEAVDTCSQTNVEKYEALKEAGMFEEGVALEVRLELLGRCGLPLPDYLRLFKEMDPTLSSLADLRESPVADTFFKRIQSSSVTGPELLRVLIGCGVLTKSAPIEAYSELFQICDPQGLDQVWEELIEMDGAGELTLYAFENLTSAIMMETSFWDSQFELALQHESALMSDDLFTREFLTSIELYFLNDFFPEGLPSKEAPGYLGRLHAGLEDKLRLLDGEVRPLIGSEEAEDRERLHQLESRKNVLMERIDLFRGRVGLYYYAMIGRDDSSSLKDMVRLFCLRMVNRFQVNAFSPSGRALVYEISTEVLRPGGMPRFIDKCRQRLIGLTAELAPLRATPELEVENAAKIAALEDESKNIGCVIDVLGILGGSPRLSRSRSSTVAPRPLRLRRSVSDGCVSPGSDPLSPRRVE